MANCARRGTGRLARRDCGTKTAGRQLDSAVTAEHIMVCRAGVGPARGSCQRQLIRDWNAQGQDSCFPQQGWTMSAWLAPTPRAKKSRLRKALGFAGLGTAQADDQLLNKPWEVTMEVETGFSMTQAEAGEARRNLVAWWLLGLLNNAGAHS